MQTGLENHTFSQIFMRLRQTFAKLVLKLHPLLSGGPRDPCPATPAGPYLGAGASGGRADSHGGAVFVPTSEENVPLKATVRRATLPAPRPPRPSRRREPPSPLGGPPAPETPLLCRDQMPPPHRRPPPRWAHPLHLQTPFPQADLPLRWALPCRPPFHRAGPFPGGHSTQRGRGAALTSRGQTPRAGALTWAVVGAGARGSSLRSGWGWGWGVCFYFCSEASGPDIVFSARWLGRCVGFPPAKTGSYPTSAGKDGLAFSSVQGNTLVDGMLPQGSQGLSHRRTSQVSHPALCLY